MHVIQSTWKRSAFSIQHNSNLHVIQNSENYHLKGLFPQKKIPWLSCGLFEKSALNVAFSII